MSEQTAHPHSAPTTGRVAALYRYPVKGLSPDTLTSVPLKVGATLAFDRAYAIENGPSPFDPADPKHLPKMHFVMLMRNEQVAGVRAAFDDTTHALTLTKDGAELARGDLRSAIGRAAIETAIADLVGPGMRGSARIVSAPDHSFSDVAAKCLHIINLESVRALERKLGTAINPLRFRPNVIVDGLPAWSEFDWVGGLLSAGKAALEVFKRTERCAATNVDPETGVRDLKIPSFLSRTYGHTDFGVYARVVSSGILETGDAVRRVGSPIA